MQKDSSGDRQTIKCNICNHVIHYKCSLLPKYVLYTYTKKKTKKFDCQVCTNVPDDFECETGIYTESSTAAKRYYIPTIKVTDEDGVELEPQIDIPSRFKTTIPDEKETAVGVCRDDRKIAQLNDLFEKYDFCTMAENLLQLGNKMESINSRLHKNLDITRELSFNNTSGSNDIDPSRNVNSNKSNNKNDSNNNSSSVNVNDKYINKMKADLDFALKDRDSFRHSYELLLVELKEADKKAWEMAERITGLSSSLQVKNAQATLLSTENEKNAKVINELKAKVGELTTKYCDVHGKWEAGHLANEILGRQLDSYMTDKNALEKNLK